MLIGRWDINPLLYCHQHYHRHRHRQLYTFNIYIRATIYLFYSISVIKQLVRSNRISFQNHNSIHWRSTQTLARLSITQLFPLTTPPLAFNPICQLQLVVWYLWCIKELNIIYIRHIARLGFQLHFTRLSHPSPLILPIQTVRSVSWVIEKARLISSGLPYCTRHSIFDLLPTWSTSPSLPQSQSITIARDYTRTTNYSTPPRSSILTTPISSLGR